jgi:hypothetical protein
METVARPNFGSIRNEGESAVLRTPPHNFEAEMALLGALLANNKAYDRSRSFSAPSISPMSGTAASSMRARS